MSRVSHYKKDEARKNEARVLKSIDQFGPIRFNEILCKLNEKESKTKMSPTTLTSHLKNLDEKRQLIEIYFSREKKAACYRIRPHEKEKVTGIGKKLEAIAFIEGILNPLYSYKEKDGKAIAAFTNRSGNKKIDDFMQKALEKEAQAYIRFFKNPIKDRKIAVVLMTGVENKEEKAK